MMLPKEIRNIISALDELVSLKEMKDLYGKTDDYKIRQPVAWKSAIDAMHKYYDSKVSKIKLK